MEKVMDELRVNAEKATRQLLEAAKLHAGDIFVVGCSSSEVMGGNIGKASSPEVAKAILQGILPVLQEKGIYLAAQCCEHLNRTLIVEREAVQDPEQIVSVIPQVHAGGSFAVAAWEAFREPTAVHTVRAAAGLDIGDTLIGMHLRRVAVPVRLDVKKLGEANLVAARTRPPFVGGSRAVYATPEQGGEVR